MLDPQVLGPKIQEMRKQLDLTQEQLGKKLGVTAQAVSKWEQGAALPDTALLPGICRILGMSADELLGLGGSKAARRSPRGAVERIDPWSDSFVVIPGILFLFAILAAMAGLLFRNAHPSFFAITVGGMAAIIVTWVIMRSLRR